MVGRFWAGKSERITTKRQVWLDAGDVVIRNARQVTCGLTTGSGDLIGWHTVEVTPDMVGSRVALFVSAEVKSASGRLSPEQGNWSRVVRESGGIAIVARSVEDAAAVLNAGA